MTTIYTDQSQCSMFRVSYFDDDESFRVRASALLKTKNYDKRHRNFLEPLGDSVLHLKRQAGLFPGWWDVVRIEQ